MQGCTTDNGAVFGRAVVLEVALGCPETPPSEGDWQALGAGTSKGLDFSPNTVNSDADDTGAWVENIVTNADATISFEGEVRKNDKLDQFGFGKLVKYFADELNAKPIRQPTIWVRLEVGPIEFTGYMVITALTPADGGTNDLVTFTVEFKVANSDTVKVEQVTPDVPVASVTVTPATSTGAVGSTVQLTANVLPSDATIKTGAWTSSDATKATVSSTGLVSRVAVGTATMTFTTTDGAKTGTSAITVTA